MVRHSKNNTASSVFTKAEYGKLRDVWGSQTARLGAESMKHLDQCCLCLSTAEGPVSCSQGHLFCRECIISSLLDQKRDMAAVQETLARLEQEQRKEREQARAEAQARIERDFECIQSGVRGSRRRSVSRASASQRDRSRSPPNRTSGTSLADLPARIAAETERSIAHAMIKLNEEHAQVKRDKIPAYWLPSLTPSAESQTGDIVRRTEEALAKGMETKCFMADLHGHPVSIKSLIDIHFVTAAADDTSAEKQRKLCPSCKKTLSDVNKLFAVRKCGHVHCSTCIDTLLRPALKKAKTDKNERPVCLECGQIIKSEDKDLIALQREGTGFALAGNHETRRSGISFQG